MSTLEKILPFKAASSQEDDTTGLKTQKFTDVQTTMDKSDDARDPLSRNLKPLSWFFVVFSLLAALFLFALDNTIVANVQENIIYTLGGIDKLAWISVAFALGAVATNLFWYVFHAQIQHHYLQV